MSYPTRTRIRSVLLAGTPYDAFLLEQAGFQRGGRGAPRHAPTFTLARTGAEVLDSVGRMAPPPDLVISEDTLPDMTAFELGAILGEVRGNVPVVVVTSRTELGGATATVPGREHVAGLFIWYGDPELLRTIVRLQEDAENAERLLRNNESLCILVVEDEPNFYSHYLPILYEQLRKSTLALIPEERHPTSPWEMVQWRPLVLLRQTFEEACTVIDRFHNQIIAVITDLQFPEGGVLRPDAGLRLLHRARSYELHMPVVVQSHQTELKAAVEGAGGWFLSKDSPHLLGELKEFLQHYCGFGPFVFRWPGGKEWGRAETVVELRALVAGDLPQAVYEHHAKHNDFSAWLSVHGYGEVAGRVRAEREVGPEGRARVLAMLDEALALGDAVFDLGDSGSSPPDPGAAASAG